jgi:hypothetical protein
MRRSFAVKSISRNMPAAALGLLLVPLVANAAAAVPASGAQSGSKPEAAIELYEGADDPAVCAQTDEGCVFDPQVARARAYLVETAHPGGTMMRQGPDVAIGRLHPEFVRRLAAAIREARTEGLAEAGIFSAYRPPAFGVGGFSDKFNSLHAYGLAVDMHGIGAPGSSQAKLWHKIAAKHGVVCPYGVNNRAEWNHCQPTRVKVIRADNPLRKTIAAEGPASPGPMFDAGKNLIESIANLFKAFTSGPAMAVQEGRLAARKTQRTRRVRTADAHRSRQHRQVRLAGRKGQKQVRAAAATGKGRSIKRRAVAPSKGRSIKQAAKQRPAKMVRRAQRAGASQFN